MTQFTRKSPLTNKVNVMEIGVTQEEWLAHLLTHNMIQDAFPQLTPEEREFLKTGYTQEDWNEIFPPEGEEK